MSRSTLVAAIVWLALASGIVYLMDGLLNPNKLAVLGEDNTVVLQRGLDGHYRAQALINGQQVDVLVDTGASGVAISQHVADRLGLQSHAGVRTSTANGDTIAYMTWLDTVKLGGVEAKNVAAMIAPGLGGDVLLGMSFLSRMDVRLHQGSMTIKQVEQ